MKLELDLQSFAGFERDYPGPVTFKRGEGWQATIVTLPGDWWIKNERPSRITVEILA